MRVSTAGSNLSNTGGYRYHDLDVREVEQKLFDGFAAASDPQVNFAMKGLVDFNNDVPVLISSQM